MQKIQDQLMFHYHNEKLSNCYILEWLLMAYLSQLVNISKKYNWMVSGTKIMPRANLILDTQAWHKNIKLCLNFYVGMQMLRLMCPFLVRIDV